jgi:hypothetical protein
MLKIPAAIVRLCRSLHPHQVLRAKAVGPVDVIPQRANILPKRSVNRHRQPSCRLKPAAKSEELANFAGEDLIVH